MFKGFVRDYSGNMALRLRRYYQGAFFGVLSLLRDLIAPNPKKRFLHADEIGFFPCRTIQALNKEQICSAGRRVVKK